MLDAAEVEKGVKKPPLFDLWVTRWQLQNCIWRFKGSLPGRQSDHERPRIAYTSLNMVPCRPLRAQKFWIENTRCDQKLTLTASLAWEWVGHGSQANER